MGREAGLTGRSGGAAGAGAGASPDPFDGFVPRRIPAELERRWLADGLWVDETIGQLLDRGLAAHAALPFVVHSAAAV